MTLDPTICYHALQSRDARFDGRFFTGVLTTGVYCRPVCPARTPRPENVRFFQSASSAQEAGFRPCLRCRPESSPGTPVWKGTAATVSRALRLMGDGVLDESGTDGLSERLGIGPRQLRRLFKQHLGASPIAVAQTRRLHMAKKLLDETSLPVTQVAFSSGFSSIRRFNASFRKLYGRSPSQLRRAIAEPGAKETLTLTLAYRPPLAGAALLGFFKARAIPGVESVAGCTYLRSICIDESVGIIQVTISQDHPHVLLEVPIHLAAYLNRIVERIRRMFDLEADPAFIEKHLGHDPRLAELIGKHPGLRVPGVWDGFELGVRAILGQQVSVRAANTLAGRLVAAYGKPFDGMSREDVTWLFPTPDRLCVAELEHIGLPGKRADAVRSLARAVRDGVLTFESRSDLDTLIQELTRLPGIGPWTANYIAMRAFGEPDAFPAGDLVLRKKMTLEGEQTLSEKGALEQAESWRPWRAYAAMYLWHE